MMKKANRVIYGVRPDYENIEKVISNILPSNSDHVNRSSEYQGREKETPVIKPGDKVGIQVSDLDIILFKDIDTLKKHQPDLDPNKEIMSAYSKRIGYDKNASKITGNKISTILFWYGIYSALKKNNNRIIALDTDRRKKLLLEYCNQMELHSENGPETDYEEKEYYHRLYRLVREPHYRNTILIPRIIKNDIDSAVVYKLHAEKTAKDTDSALKLIDPLPEHHTDPFQIRFIEELERLWTKLKDDLPDLDDQNISDFNHHINPYKRILMEHDDTH